MTTATEVEVTILDTLAIYDAMTLAELAEMSGLERSTVAPRIGAMVKKGTIQAGIRHTSGKEPEAVWMLAEGAA